MGFDLLSPKSTSTANNTQVGVDTGGGGATTQGGGNKGNAALGGAVLNLKSVKIANANKTTKRVLAGPLATQPAAQGNGGNNPTLGNSNNGGVQSITTINSPDDNAINAIQHISELALAASDDENGHLIALTGKTITGSQILQGNQASLAGQIAQTAQDQSAQIAESATTDPRNQTELQASVTSGANKNAEIQLAVVVIGIAGVVYFMQRKG